MSSDLMKGTQAMLAERGDGEVAKTVGASMFKVGAGGTAVWFVAGMLPFITMPMLLVLLVLGGGALYLKGS